MSRFDHFDMRVSRTVVPFAFALLAMFSPTIQAHEEKEIQIGRNATGQLKVRLPSTQPVMLEKSVFPGFPGSATAMLAIHSAFRNEPADDFFELSENSNLRLILLAKDPGMEIWNSTGYMAVGEAFYLGPPYFDNHPIWNLTNGIGGNTYSLTFKARDLAGIHAETPPFTITFMPVAPLPVHITSAGSPQAVLLWPTNAIWWELQSAASITTTNWTVVTNTPSVVGTNFSLNLPATQSQQFYRLRYFHVD